jgi:glycosyltransferase involved in cell wall biosynthesis
MIANKIIIDSVYLNSEGGKAILFQLIDFLKQENLLNKYYFLIDSRISMTKPFLNLIDFEFIKASEKNRRNFYLKVNDNYKSIICMSNVPPPIKFNKNVFIYFHNDLLINPLRTNLDIIDRGFNLMKKLYIKFLNNNSYKWIVQTKLMKKNLSNSFSINPNKIKIFPIFDSNSKYYNQKNKKNKFLYVSNLSKHKNHKRLINAFIDVADKSNKLIELHLTISEYQYKSSIYSKLKYPKNLIIKNHGILNKSDLNNLYNSSYFLIFPSLNESFGLPLIESINNNCKVIASDLPYVTEIIEPSIKFNPESIYSITQSISAALEEKSLKNSKILIENKIDTFVEYISHHV